MTLSGVESVSPNPRNQITVTLSDKALEEYELLARWKNQPLRSLLREVLEQNHLSPAFGAVLRRARRDLEINPDQFEDEE